VSGHRTKLAQANFSQELYSSNPDRTSTFNSKLVGTETVFKVGSVHQRRLKSLKLCLCNWAKRSAYKKDQMSLQSAMKKTKTIRVKTEIKKCLIFESQNYDLNL
jgi:hypothetical protein